MKVWNVLILVNEHKDHNLKITKEVITFLNNNNCQVYIEEEISSKVSEAKILNKDSVVDFALVLGGDGTLLNGLHKYVEKDFPYFGINLGRVGCLLEANTTNYKDKISSILHDKYFIEKRNTLEYVVKNNENTYKGIAFNEVALERGKLFKMLLINMYINGNNKTSFYADGVIVATSTGSSAFSLSSGGPLLLPSAKNFVITPLCPQLRNITSLVVNDTDVISIDIKDLQVRESYKDNKPIVTIDGRIMIDIDENSNLTITKSPKILKIIKVNGQESYFEPTFKVAMSNQNLFNN
ncbi:MAG: NAD(+)/NADH kinase [Bacilli bacterium]|nr:NAD(+)/NADH kinase [Acholeplasmataceae bacterium]MDY2902506.1 NAD(+)/NADH kinase [Bacilli bacterium]